MKIKNIFTLGLTLLCLSASSLNAADLSDLLKSFNVAMKAKDYETGLKVVNEIITDYGRGAKLNYGSKFGEFYYNKSICEMQLGKYDAAEESLKICLTKFANDPDTDPKRKNNYANYANYKLAELAKLKKDNEKALSYINAFIANYDPSNKYEAKVNLANLKLDKVIFSVDNNQVEVAFDLFKELLVEPEFYDRASLHQGWKVFFDLSGEDENLHKKLVQLLESHPQALNLFPLESLKSFSEQLKFSSSASSPEQIYYYVSQISSMQDMLNEAEAGLNRLKNRDKIKDGEITYSKAYFEALKSEIEKRHLQKESLDYPLEIKKVQALKDLGQTSAVIKYYEELDQGSQEVEESFLKLAYFSLLDLYSQLENRDKELFYANKAKSLGGKAGAGSIHLITINSFFQSKNYKSAISYFESNKSEISKLKDTYPDCLFLAGVSYYLQANYDEARELFDELVAEFPEHKEANQSAYYACRSLYLLNKIDQGINAYKEYIDVSAVAIKEDTFKTEELREKVVNNFGRAHVDLANLYKQKGELENSNSVVDNFALKFPELEQVDSALMVKADNLFQMQETSKGLELITKITDSSVAKKDNGMIAQALIRFFAVVSPEIESEEGKQALAWYQAYIDGVDYANPYHSFLLGEAKEFLLKAQPADLTLEHLRKGIEAAPATVSLEKTLSFYAELLLDKQGIDSARTKIDSLNFAATTTTRKAWKELALIQIYQKIADQEKTDKYATTIEGLVKNLRGLNAEDLPSKALLSVAEFLHYSSKTPQEAIGFYGVIQDRGQDEDLWLTATMGRAELLGVSPDAEKRKEAASILLDVYKDESQLPENREKALYQALKIYEFSENWPSLEKFAAQYLDKKKHQFRKYSPEVSLLYATSFAERDMKAEAISAYAKVFGGHQSAARVSAPAIYEWMKLIWERNQGEDRQQGYLTGWEFAKGMQPFIERMTDDEKAKMSRLEALISQYENEPGIKTKEQLLQEKLKNL